MTSLMSEPITKEERLELVRRAEKLHVMFNLGGAYPVGDYVIDAVEGAGVWVYDHSESGAGKQVFSSNISNSHVDHADPDEVREVLDALRRQMILEDLADV